MLHSRISTNKAMCRCDEGSRAAAAGVDPEFDHLLGTGAAAVQRAGVALWPGSARPLVGAGCNHHRAGGHSSLPLVLSAGWNNSAHASYHLQTGVADSPLAKLEGSPMEVNKVRKSR